MNVGLGTPECAVMTLLWAIREAKWELVWQVNLWEDDGARALWSRIVSKDGVESGCSDIFIVGSLDMSAERAIVLGRFGGESDATVPILAFDMRRLGKDWILVQIRLY